MKQIARSLFLLFFTLTIIWIAVSALPKWTEWFEIQPLNWSLILGAVLGLVNLAGKIFQIEQATFDTSNERERAN